MQDAPTFGTAGRLRAQVPTSDTPICLPWRGGGPTSPAAKKPMPARRDSCHSACNHDSSLVTARRGLHPWVVSTPAPDRAFRFHPHRAQPRPSFRTEQADFLTPPTPQPSFRMKHANFTRPAHTNHRHFERSRPTFSSAFAPANASAYAERNLSSLRALRRGLFTLSGAEGPRPCASAVLQWI